MMQVANFEKDNNQPGHIKTRAGTWPGPPQIIIGAQAGLSPEVVFQKVDPQLATI